MDALGIHHGISYNSEQQTEHSQLMYNSSTGVFFFNLYLCKDRQIFILGIYVVGVRETVFDGNHPPSTSTQWKDNSGTCFAKCNNST